MSIFDKHFDPQVEVEESHDVVVIGGGLMGATITKALRQSRDVLIVDDKRDLAGTPPSGGTIKPSPLTGLKKVEEYFPLLDLLGELYGGLYKEPFEIRPSGKLINIDIYQLKTFRVMGTPKRFATALSIDPKSKTVLIREKEKIHKLYANTIIVCTGGWIRELLPMIFPEGSVKIKIGICFKYQRHCEQAFVNTWAPYKQVTVHPFWESETNEITWASDGTAILAENWTRAREKKCLKRITNHLPKDFPPPFKIQKGYRPFLKKRIPGKPCFLEEVYDDIWATTGSGKFGCVAAGWAAIQLKEILS
jgi:hypothetical protein